MTSKEVFNKLQHYINGTELSGKELLECYKTIDKDLDRLEKLEKTIDALKQIGLVILWRPTEKENVYSILFNFEKKQLYTSKDILKELITIFEKNIMY